MTQNPALQDENEMGRETDCKWLELSPWDGYSQGQNKKPATCALSTVSSPTTDCLLTLDSQQVSPVSSIQTQVPFQSMFLPSSPMHTLATPSLLWSHPTISHTEHGSLAAGFCKRYSFNYVKLGQEPARLYYLWQWWYNGTMWRTYLKPRFLPSPLLHHHHHTATKRICISNTLPGNTNTPDQTPLWEHWPLNYHV